ncbi:MAG: Crp/Fnr family transcriptional regulator [Candidatus Schekmanbacteria bacterium]|nr:Crp/Fnr family transcriptional regulator [Candidatus Schekmanbacteria bacterium]
MDPGRLTGVQTPRDRATSTAMIELATIAQIPRFAGISPDGHAWLAEHSLRNEYARGEQIFAEGEPCVHFHLILRGTVKISKFLENGRELILDLFGRGEAIGEVALIDGAGYPANATAHEDTVTLVLPRADYLELLRRFPEAPLAFIRDLIMRMRTLSNRVHDLGGGGVEYRLARVLLAFGRQSGSREGTGWRVPVQLSRQELADLVGARIETVIRVFSKWRKEQFVETTSDGFLVLDPGRLERMIHNLEH